MRLHLFTLGEGLVWVIFDDMSRDDIHLRQNWAKWDIALVLKNLTEQWLSCLLSLGWFLVFFKFFFEVFCLSELGLLLDFIWIPKFWAETVEWMALILVQHSIFKIYHLLLRLLPILQPSSTVAYLTLAQIHWYQCCQEVNQVMLSSCFSFSLILYHLKYITLRSVGHTVPQWNQHHHTSRVCSSYTHSSMCFTFHYVCLITQRWIDWGREGRSCMPVLH